MLLAVLAAAALGHDIPNARVDRAIQATVRPGRLEVDYEVSLAELTLAQDLRALVGPLPGGDRETLFDRYGREVGPLNAKGLLAWVDGVAIPLGFDGFDLAVEEHPRYTFHFSAPLPGRGRLLIRDTNYVSSGGTSRLAIRGGDGAEVAGDDLPGNVAEIPDRPTWQLSVDEERRTKEVEVAFAAPAEGPAVGSRVEPEPPARPEPRPSARTPKPWGRDRLAGLLDRPSGGTRLGLWLLALALGSAHAIQPGHGKTLVAATAAGERGGPWQGVLLALITTTAHTGSVLVVTAALWATRATRYAAINATLAAAAGFIIAAIGLWRLGRHLAGFGEHDGEDHEPQGLGVRSLLGLGLAGGLVPCWDAVILIIVAGALGRLPLGLLLLSGFSLGMACVLVLVGLAAGRARRLVAARDVEGRWERRLGIVGGAVLAGIGLYLLTVSGTMGSATPPAPGPTAEAPP